MTISPPVQIPLKSIELTPGSCLTLHDINWEEFTAIQDALDERPSIRLAYCNKTLELVSPLPAHERPHRIIADIVKVLLDAQNRDWEDFGSSTLRRRQKSAGVEPDTAFYIQNADRMRNCMRLDLDTDPPPDLAIESDLTSKTTLDAYEQLQVPELWIYEAGQLRINLLENGKYQEYQYSAIFPNMAIIELIPRLVNQAFMEGSSRMLRNFRADLSKFWV